VYSNTIGPYRNPQEVYTYSSYISCPTIPGPFSIGAILSGNRLEEQTGIKIHYIEPVERGDICTIEFTPELAVDLKEAIREQYWYQFYVDDIPVWGLLGEIDDSEQAVIFSHQSFSIGHSDGIIKQVNLTTDRRVSVAASAKVSFTYSVNWITLKETEDRYAPLIDPEFFRHQVHYLALFNSFMMLIFLLGLCYMIYLRTVRTEATRHGSEDDDMELERFVDELGWKKLHGDVFRQPYRLSMLCAFVGIGYQILAIVFAISIASFVYPFYQHVGSILTSSIILFLFTSFINGYKSNALYKIYGAIGWKELLPLSLFLLPIVVVGIYTFLNSLAVSIGSSQAVPFSVMLFMLALFMIIGAPFGFIGSVYARRRIHKRDFPTRVTNLPLPVPATAWYYHPFLVILGSGLISFGTIFIELYFLFTSYWNYKFYFVYDMFFMVLCVFVLVTICSSIIVIFFLLNCENHHWQWPAFFSGASVGFYTFLYGIYYYSTRTHMDGFFQSMFYSGHLIIFSVVIAFAGGSVSYSACDTFIRKIYDNAKHD